MPILLIHPVAIRTWGNAAIVGELEQLAEQEPGDPYIQFALAFWRAFAAFDGDEAEQAATHARQAIEGMNRAGGAAATSAHAALLGYASFLLTGDTNESERLVLEAIRQLEELQENLFRSSALTALAEIRTAQGRPQEALTLLEQADQHGRHDKMTLIWACRARAHAYASSGAIEEAKTAASEAVATAATTDSPTEQAESQYTLAETLLAAGELPAALGAAQQARLLYAPIRHLQAHRASALADEIQRHTNLTPTATP